MIFLSLFLFILQANAEFLNNFQSQLINTNSTEFSNVEQKSFSSKYSTIVKRLNYRDYILKSTFCPGLGQFFLKRYTKAIFFYSSFVLSIGTGIYFYSKADDIYQDYLKAETTSSAVFLYDEYLKNKKTSDHLFLFSIFIWAYNIFDVYLDVKWINDKIDLKENNLFSFKLYEKKF